MTTELQGALVEAIFNYHTASSVRNNIVNNLHQAEKDWVNSIAELMFVIQEIAKEDGVTFQIHGASKSE
jgi:flagellar motor switch protein FliG